MFFVLSIRQYTRQTARHRHDHGQIVIPIRGQIQIDMDNFSGKISVSQGIVISQMQWHAFSASSEAAFLVADLDLPENLLALPTPVFVLTPSLQQYVTFAEVQLLCSANEQVFSASETLLIALLQEQNPCSPPDKRIQQALHRIHQQFNQPISIENLAAVACLAPTQFKKVFKAQTGSTPGQYIQQVRMQTAKQLLRHSDTPITNIAEQCGYQDSTAFSRRFRQFYGVSPRSFRT